MMDNQPLQQPPQKGKYDDAAVLSLISGIVSILYCVTNFYGWIFISVGLIVGILAFFEPSTRPTRKWMALAGIISASVGLVLTILYFIFIAVLSTVATAV